jgi:hypothetical protein
METVMSNEAVALLSPGPGYTIMLTLLSQFQAQGWEKWLSWIGFAWKGRHFTVYSIALIVGSEIELDCPFLQLLAYDMCLC